MQARRAVVGATILALLAVVAAGAVAADAKSFTLMGQKDSPKASGTATVEGNTLTITAKGLKANAVYTTWFVNMQPSMSKAGAGTPPYSFKTDGKGTAKYTAALSESPVGKWQAIFIVRHPSGDPMAMDNMEDALMAKLM
jgi:uncharacterized membrane protein YebE (DUF533 family)